MRKLIREYLTFNKRERNGVIVLLAIVFVLLIYLSLAPKFHAVQQVDFSAFEKQEQAFKQHSLQRDTFSEVISSAEEKTIQSFYFDPNKVTREQLIQLGVPPKTASAMVHYVEKGGKFRTKEDVKKIYGMNEPIFALLEPNMIFENKEKQIVAEQKTEYKKKEIKVTELNAADSVTLLTINGVGPVFAGRILKFRNKLGGFISVNQLKEVYGIDSVKLNQIIPQVKVDTSLIKKIDLNQAAPDQLKSHPYFKSGIAYHIINYRKQHGDFTSLEQLKKIKLMNDSVFNKIVPYLNIK